MCIRDRNFCFNFKMESEKRSDAQNPDVIALLQSIRDIKGLREQRKLLAKTFEDYLRRLEREVDVVPPARPKQSDCDVALERLLHFELLDDQVPEELKNRLKTLLPKVPQSELLDRVYEIFGFKQPRALQIFQATRPQNMPRGNAERMEQEEPWHRPLKLKKGLE
eukprot:TRINITY_DN12869_c0_g1_i1.p1 TRINITY_DN12869_c0_g1~~TRINITY_DN12869_c0_g1_i1.p1  ORF type:complete len:165 (-),score=27.94 TRINITY_DN12869_c0_g1_i1:83-577(-)